jgi:hypothetical protein
LGALHLEFYTHAGVVRLGSCMARHAQGLSRLPRAESRGPSLLLLLELELDLLLPLADSGCCCCSIGGIRVCRRTQFS